MSSFNNLVFARSSRRPVMLSEFGACYEKMVNDFICVSRFVGAVVYDGALVGAGDGFWRHRKRMAVYDVPVNAFCGDGRNDFDSFSGFDNPMETKVCLS